MIHLPTSAVSSPDDLNRKGYFAPKGFYVFIFLWLLTFLFYYPAAQAGKVGDYYFEWVRRVANHDLRYIITAPYGDSLYYSSLLFMTCCYKLFGLSAWAWHLLAVTVHVASATLIYRLLCRLFCDSGLNEPALSALWVSVMYCVSPYNTEVIVHEHCFAYTTAYFTTLLTIYYTLQFITSNRGKYAWYAAVSFIIASFDIEVFYIVPVISFSLILFYVFVVNSGEGLFRRAFRNVVLPQLAILVFYFGLLYKVTGQFFAHRVNEKIGHFFYYFLSVSPKRIFYSVFMGRFLPEEMRGQVSAFFDSSAGMWSFVVFVMLCIIYVILRSGRNKKMSVLTGLLMIWVGICLFITATSYFPVKGYVTYDRYVYFLLPFVYGLMVVLVNQFRSWARWSLLMSYMLLNAVLLVKMNGYWFHSARLISNLMATFPVRNDGRVILLLNVPENLNGVLMTGSRPMAYYTATSAFREDYNYEHKRRITDDVCDIASYNLVNTGDGAHVRVVNDTELHVFLNNSKSTWWQYYQTAMNTDNGYYHLDMIDTNCWYRLVLKHPSSRFVLLYTAGDHWKEVDINKRNEDQY